MRLPRATRHSQSTHRDCPIGRKESASSKRSNNRRLRAREIKTQVLGIRGIAEDFEKTSSWERSNEAFARRRTGRDSLEMLCERFRATNEQRKGSRGLRVSSESKMLRLIKLQLNNWHPLRIPGSFCFLNVRLEKRQSALAERIRFLSPEKLPFDAKSEPGKLNRRSFASPTANARRKVPPAATLTSPLLCGHSSGRNGPSRDLSLSLSETAKPERIRGRQSIASYLLGGSLGSASLEDPIHGATCPRFEV